MQTTSLIILAIALAVASASPGPSVAALVARVVAKEARDVLPRAVEEIDVWMNAPAEEALQLQRPLPDTDLIVLETPKVQEEVPTLF